MGMVALVAIAIPLVLWWAFDMDMGGGLAVGSYFPTALVGWLGSKGRKPFWAVFWSTLGGIVWPIVLAALWILEGGQGWWLPGLAFCVVFSFVLGPIVGLYVSLAFRIARPVGKPAKQAIVEV
jgi:hypothetical protein